jgi:outer membrane receptor protein involved in Fe transport
VSYDPLRKPVPGYGVLNLRLGSRFSGVDLSFFVHNLTNVAPSLELSHSTFYDPQDWQSVAMRPRTYGLTFTLRK